MAGAVDGDTVKRRAEPLRTTQPAAPFPVQRPECRQACRIPALEELLRVEVSLRGGRLEGATAEPLAHSRLPHIAAAVGKCCAN